MKFGLIGEKLGHSYSKVLHGYLAEYEYDLLPMPPEDVPAFMQNNTLGGFNVTIPYKQKVIPFLAEMSDTAKEIGSVNTVVRRRDGSYYGDNTDAYGFDMLCKSIGAQFGGKKTVILGSGGTSRTAQCVVRRQGGTPVVVSRNGENNYENLHLHRDAEYLINTTPVGMYPKTEAAPVDLQLFPCLKGVVDVIYNPMRTRLVQQAESLGIPAAGGLKMLVYQAVRAAEQFAGRAFSQKEAVKAEAALRASSLNLVLVGMPGCGKTTIGRALAELLQREAVDTDEVIAREAGKTIPEIFAEEGETGFRRREADVIRRYGSEAGRILLTGGGAVIDPENRKALRQNGFVVHITRNLDLLAMDGRPLSKDRAALDRLWQKRQALYADAADMVISNEATPGECAMKIQEAWNETLRS